MRKDETQCKITLFSSALPSEGKTLVSANFAASAACQGRKTLLIDLDLRRPSVHKFFGVPRGLRDCGIADSLAGQVPLEDLIFRDTGHDNLHLLLAGRHAANPVGLLETGRLREVLARACQEYDVVVLDTAPVLSASDTRFVAPQAHNFCFVVKAGHVSAGAVRRALTILAEDGIQPDGIVFNGYRERSYLVGENFSYGYYQQSRYGGKRYIHDAYGQEAPCGS